MAGWNLKNGMIKDYNASEDEYWTLFNFVFSNGSKKRNTYKFGLVKSLLDNLFNGINQEEGVFFSYETLFSKFAENYWNLVVKYDLRQMRKDGRSSYSKIESILLEAVTNNEALVLIGYEGLSEKLKTSIVEKVIKECKRNVVGALYQDFDGRLYGFDLKGEGLYLAPNAYEFLLKHKAEIEMLNYYAWAKFLETINEDEKLIHVIDKLELSTPKRSDLSRYRVFLQEEVGENKCFYCKQDLKRRVHVDHFIPWSFVKDDKLWNMVLSCPKCNQKKKDRIPTKEFLVSIEKRNVRIQHIDSEFVCSEFSGYTENLLEKLWKYAKYSGLKEYHN